ncbi:MAG TPA: TonB-dependent receptor [Oligoflexia bacterium]|nr:TonB-dependent receptor [Oligoflexia bacterium]HMP47535.1 TonB-dependent receptor [Oligoflexia bacterium]
MGKHNKISGSHPGKFHLIWTSCICFFGIIFLNIYQGSLAKAAEQPIANLYSSQGTTEAFFINGTEWTPVEAGREFSVGDQVRTGPNSRAGIKFSDGFLIRLSRESAMTFKPQEKGAKSNAPVSVEAGASHFFSRKSRSFPNIETPHVSASVRGTEFVVKVEEGKTTISVLDGVVIAENDHGSVSLSKGEEALTLAGKAPVKAIMLKPEDAVQWALYYPPLIDLSFFQDDYARSVYVDEYEALFKLRSGEVGLEEINKRFSINKGSSKLGILGQSLSYYETGDYGKALSYISNISEGEKTAKLLLFEAALNLGLGKIQEVNLIHEALSSGNTSRHLPLTTELESLYTSQKALLLLVGNKKMEAKKLIQPFVTSEKDSPEEALLAASYIAQAEFDLEAARQFLERLYAKNPNHDLARARLAELYLSLGEEKKALSLLGSDTEGKGAYGAMVLGFLYLAKKDTKNAVSAFQQSVKMDQSLALPRLGLGLAAINEGELEKGRTEIEYAAQLEPNVSIYRSYLGKAYYEEYNPEKASKEFARAIELDPEDPTPYLYRSFLHLTEHRPVEALRDVQSSIEKNNNRAVYRSKLLLDQDAATRTNSLGQIFNRVGFTQLARLEAIKSLNKDYSNFSAHYLLADVFSKEHQNSRAQTTENLLGRLLSPVTFNANNINVGGEASINEYTTLYDAPVDRINLEGRAGSALRTLGGTVEYISVDQDLGYNLGYTTDYRKGFRDNDYEKNHQFFSLGQAKLSSDSTFVWDGALTANRAGDLLVNTDPYTENKEIETDLESFLIRTGIHHRFGPGFHFVGQVFYNYGDNGANDQNVAGRINQFRVEEDGVSVTRDPFPFNGTVQQMLERRQHLAQTDAQFILDRELVSLVAGSSFRYDRVKGQESGSIDSPGSSEAISFVNGFPISSVASIDQLTHRTYLYSTWHLTDELDVNLGVTYAWLRYSDNSENAPFVDDTYDKDAFSPKLGFMYNLTSSTTLRGSYGQTLDRTDRNNVGPLEPTFVGGFNQVFDGIKGSRQELYAIGVDQSLPTESFVGVNYQRRHINLNVPFTTGGLVFDQPTGNLSESRFVQNTSGKAIEDRVGAYFYQLLGSEFTYSLDYLWEFFEQGAPLPEIETALVRNQLNYFHSSGLFALCRTTWRNQARAGAFDEKQKNDFWLFDLGVGYEFDNRKGSVSVLFNNIFDRSFRYSSPRDEQFILPEFNAVLSATYTF